MDGKVARVANPTNLERVTTTIILRRRGIGTGIGMESQVKVTSLVKVLNRPSLVTPTLNRHRSRRSLQGALPADLPVDQAVNPRASQWL